MARLTKDQHALLTATVDRWLKKHYREPIDLPALAREVGITRFLLCRLYSERSGKTIRLKQREIRVNQAAKLLADGTRKIGDVAREVGYGSVSHFTKAFVDEKGMLPSAWRSRPRIVSFPDTSGSLPGPGLACAWASVGDAPPGLSRASGRWVAAWAASLPPGTGRRSVRSSGRLQYGNAFLD
jgi:AraC-like DNA-binding protein